MHCTTCGAPVPAGRSACGTCGSRALAVNGGVGAGALPAFTGSRALPDPIAVCPRCHYPGQGLPYFTRGPHRAALVGATLSTMPWALGAGGIFYYAMRRDHRLCPRCGSGWGKAGETALAARLDHSPAPEPSRSLPSIIHPLWAPLLMGVGILLLTIGLVELEAVLIVLGGLAGAGAVALHRASRRSREERRAALIADLQLPVLKLAAERQGRLTVTEVAAALGWPIPRAEKVLHSLDDGWRVSSEVTDEGVIVYEFRELLLGWPRSGPPEDAPPLRS
jgi:hypothetical protein